MYCSIQNLKYIEWNYKYKYKYNSNDKNVKSQLRGCSIAVGKCVAQEYNFAFFFLMKTTNIVLICKNYGENLGSRILINAFAVSGKFSSVLSRALRCAKYGAVRLNKSCSLHYSNFQKCGWNFNSENNPRWVKLYFDKSFAPQVTSGISPIM